MCYRGQGDPRFNDGEQLLRVGLTGGNGFGVKSGERRSRGRGNELGDASWRQGGVVAVICRCWDTEVRRVHEGAEGSACGRTS